MIIKWTIDQNLKCKTVKILAKNPGEALCGLKLGKYFLDMIPEVQTMKEPVGKLYYIKFKNFYNFKGIFTRMKRQSAD